MGRKYAYRCVYTHTTQPRIRVCSEVACVLYAMRSKHASVSYTRAHKYESGVYTPRDGYTGVRIRVNARVLEILRCGRGFGLKILPRGRMIFIFYLLPRRFARIKTGNSLHLCWMLAMAEGAGPRVKVHIRRVPSKFVKVDLDQPGLRAVIPGRLLGL
jgi:hypothetical protein